MQLKVYENDLEGESIEMMGESVNISGESELMGFPFSTLLMARAIRKRRQRRRKRRKRLTPEQRHAKMLLYQKMLERFRNRQQPSYFLGGKKKKLKKYSKGWYKKRYKQFLKGYKKYKTKYQNVQKAGLQPAPEMPGQPMDIQKMLPLLAIGGAALFFLMPKKKKAKTKKK